MIPLMFSEKLLDVRQDYTGCDVCIAGQLRSYNWHEGTRSRLVLSVFVREIVFLEKEPESIRENNQISLEGFLCKVPVYRKTPLGREIADILLAVNRPYGKSDYIPCIAWGRNAGFAARLEVGMQVRIQGRIQSREYIKRLTETEAEPRVTYEVSASMLKVETGTEGEES